MCLSVGKRIWTKKSNKAPVCVCLNALHKLITDNRKDKLDAAVLGILISCDYLYAPYGDLEPGKILFVNTNVENIDVDKSIQIFF